jgi:hypothetical protein
MLCGLSCHLLGALRHAALLPELQLLLFDLCRTRQQWLAVLARAGYSMLYLQCLHGCHLVGALQHFMVVNAVGGLRCRGAHALRRTVSFTASQPPLLTIDSCSVVLRSAV